MRPYKRARAKSQGDRPDLMVEQMPAPRRVSGARANSLAAMSADELSRFVEVVPLPADPVTSRVHGARVSAQVVPGAAILQPAGGQRAAGRSEERRVGKECRL